MTKEPFVAGRLVSTGHASRPRRRLPPRPPRGRRRRRRAGRGVRRRPRGDPDRGRRSRHPAGRRADRPRSHVRGDLWQLCRGEVDGRIERRRHHAVRERRRRPPRPHGRRPRLGPPPRRPSGAALGSGQSMSRRGRGDGRRARSSGRHAVVASQPFLTRPLQPVELVSEEGLELLERNADIILREVGIEVRDYPSAVERFAAAGADVDGARVRFPPGLCRQLVSTAPATYTQHARNPANSVQIGGTATVFAPNYGSPFVHDLDAGRRYATLADFENFVQARLPPPAPPPLRRHGVRAGRRAGQQAAPRHGVRPPALERQGVHGLGDGRRAGGRQRRAGPDRLRRRPRRPHGDDEPDQRLVATGVGRVDAGRGRGLRRRQPGDDHHAVHPRRGDGAGDVGRRRRPDVGRGAGRDGVRAARAARRPGDLRLVRQLDVDADRGADVRHPRAGARAVHRRRAGPSARRAVPLGRVADGVEAARRPGRVRERGDAASRR